jgi:hypothetical protein
MRIRVDCYAGYRGEETPRRLTMGTRRIEVKAIEDRWLAPDHRYFRLLGDDGGRYIIRHDPILGTWQLTWFRDSSLTGRQREVDTESDPPSPC